jgi:2-polyprenyl-3-methyl-5-hydroxy-6-metoxy-1,4-benzoquinol methylase
MPPIHDDLHSEHGILPSWERNAFAWTQTVRDGHIESRRAATDDAIIDATLQGEPGYVLDLGCGEGWLVRALAARGVRAIGVDAVPDLIAHAQAAGGDFQVASYDDIIAGRLALRIDTVVCNFALLGKDSVERLVPAVAALLQPGGRFVIQTIHPLVACGEQPYRDGWREENWTAFGTAFASPAPWYFRTLSSWVALFARSGWQLCEMREPLHPGTGRPASVLFVLRRP